MQSTEMEEIKLSLSSEMENSQVDQVLSMPRTQIQKKSKHHLKSKKSSENIPEKKPETKKQCLSEIKLASKGYNQSKLLQQVPEDVKKKIFEDSPKEKKKCFILCC